jgi:hypothetical protein
LSDGIQQIGKALVVLGLVIVGVGLLLMLSARASWIGRLPGDIMVRKKNFVFYFPLATSILISLILSLLVWLIRRR